MYYGRSLVEEQPCCSECGSGPLVFVKDDMCRIMDASRGRLTCDACGHKETATMYWRMKYDREYFRTEPSEMEQKRHADREFKKQQRLEANEKWADQHPAPDGWDFVFRLEPRRGEKLRVLILGTETVATFQGRSTVEVDNRRYIDAYLDPPIMWDGELCDDLQIDERFPAQRIED